MSARAYVLLDVEQGQSAKVVRALRGLPGGIRADVIEGPPDVVMVVEARGQRRLAELTIKTLNSIEHMVGDRKVLPVSVNGSGRVPIIAAGAPKSGNRISSGRGEKASTRRNTTEKKGARLEG